MKAFFCIGAFIGISQEGHCFLFVGFSSTLPSSPVSHKVVCSDWGLFYKHLRHSFTHYFIHLVCHPFPPDLQNIICPKPLKKVLKKSRIQETESLLTNAKSNPKNLFWPKKFMQKNFEFFSFGKHKHKTTNIRI